jgi:hypothetical protein
LRLITIVLLVLLKSWPPHMTAKLNGKHQENHLSSMGNEALSLDYMMSAAAMTFPSAETKAPDR